MMLKWFKTFLPPFFFFFSQFLPLYFCGFFSTNSQYDLFYLVKDIFLCFYLIFAKNLD